MTFLFFYSELGEVISFNKEQFIDNTKSLLDKYKSIGLGRIEFEVKNTLKVPNAIELAYILWHFKKSDGTAIYSANTNYLLKKIMAYTK